MLSSQRYDYIDGGHWAIIVEIINHWIGERESEVDLAALGNV